MKNTPENKSAIFERQFKEFYALLTLVSFCIVKDRDVAKDIVQDFFVSYWQRKDVIVFQTSFKAYASKAVKNLSLQFVQKNIKEHESMKQVPVQKIIIPQFEEKDSRIDKKLNSLLNELPQRRRDIFVSAVINGNSYSKIAEEYNISINTVKTQIKRAYSFFREELQQEEIIFLLALFLLK